MNVEPASKVAASICWLARQSGLPPSPTLRAAIAERHATSCAWCDWPLEALLDTQMDPTEERAFARLPHLRQRALVDQAQGEVGA